jgi:ketosteroid isomerase-like protein
MFGEFEEAWAEHRSEPEEIRAIDSDRVLVLSVEHFRGRDGMEVSAPCAQVFTISGDKIVRYQAFWNRETALAATGVSE